jgi:hypothetical protein
LETRVGLEAKTAYDEDCQCSVALCGNDVGYRVKSEVSVAVVCLGKVD